MTPTPDKDSTTTQAAASAVVVAASGRRRVPTGRRVGLADDAIAVELTLLSEEEVEAFLGTVFTLTDAQLDQLLLRAQIEADKRAYDAEHDPEIAPRFPFVVA